MDAVEILWTILHAQAYTIEVTGICCRYLSIALFAAENYSHDEYLEHALILKQSYRCLPTHLQSCSLNSFRLLVVDVLLDTCCQRIIQCEREVNSTPTTT